MYNTLNNFKYSELSEEDKKEYVFKLSKIFAAYLDGEQSSEAGKIYAKELRALQLSYHSPPPTLIP